MPRLKQALPLVLVLVAVCITYANHFNNGFHTDDLHTVLDNPAVRSLDDLPRFFADATTFSVVPSDQNYRPFVTASFAVDYAFGHGYVPFWFHFSTFILFLAQLGVMYALFTLIFDVVRPTPQARFSNRIVAALGVAWYGLHPAIADTVNSIAHRADIYCTLGVTAALVVYGRYPNLRRTGLYLLPFGFALLNRPTAAFFPVLLILYIAFFERDADRRTTLSLWESIPSLVLGAIIIVFQAVMTPRTFAPALLPLESYRVTQPYVLFRYFRSLFVPIHLDAHPSLEQLQSSRYLITGITFMVLFLVAGWLSARKRFRRPIAFGLLWFVITSLPTSLYAQPQIESNDRMFLPFVGLVLAVVWTVFLGAKKITRPMPNALQVQKAIVVCATILIIAYACGTILRNSAQHAMGSQPSNDAAITAPATVSPTN